MAYINNMKLGWIGYMYQPPADITEPMDKILWQLEEAKRYGCQVLQPIAELPSDEESVAKIKAKMAECDVEYEMGAPRAIFELCGENAETAKKELQAAIDLAKRYDAKIMRCGYGKLNVEYSRWSKVPGMLPHEQLRRITDSLKVAAPIFEANDMLYALENHCDFTGKEIAAIFEEINSPNMGIAYDTANGFAILCDPNEDLEAMAPWAITSHIKDSKVIDAPFGPDYFPMTPVGCALGEGGLDIPRAVKLLIDNVRYPEGFHLILEQGWFGKLPEGTDPRDFAIETMEKSLDYLKNLITVK